MKKTISTIITAAMLLGFAACGDNKNDAAEDNATTTATTTGDTTQMHEEHGMETAPSTATTSEEGTH
jgi:hypothetical protein